MRKAPKTKRKGYANGTNQNGIEMGWMTYANQARGMAESNVEYEEIVDPKTGQVYRQPKTKEDAIVAATAKPAHETWMEDIKSGNTKQLAADIFLTPLGGNIVRGKGGFEDPEFEKNRQRINSESAQQDALAARDRGETGFTATETYRKPEQTAKNPFLMGKLENTTKDVYQNPAKTLIPKAFGFNKGGEIKGAGTGTSDSINAEIKEGAFIVPAKNALFAKKIRKNVLKDDPNKKATLHEGKSAVPVKVSNGEHKFTPEEKEEIIEKTGEETLEMLAPEADDNNDFATGGEIGDDDYAKKELEKLNAEKKAAEEARKQKAISDKELSKKFDEQRKRKEQLAKKYDLKKAWEKDYKEKETKYKALKDSYDLFSKQSEDALKASKKANPYLPKLNSEEGERGKREGLLKKLSAVEKEYNDAKKLYDASQNEYNWNEDGTIKSKSVPMTSLSGSNKKASAIVGKTIATPFSEPPVKTGAELTGAATPKRKSVNPFNNEAWANSLRPTLNLEAAEIEQDIPNVTNPNANAIDTVPIAKSEMDKPFLDSIERGKQEYAAEKAAQQNQPNFWDKVSRIGGGNLLNAGLAAGQIAMGLKGLNDKRPVFDKIAEASKATGFTPEQNFMLDQNNQNLLNQEIFAARNFAGGSASNAYNMTRSALNNAFNRTLEKTVADSDLQRNKQVYEDNKALQKTQLNRMIFEDSLNAFNQKQTANANLLGTGISNALDVNRFNQFMKLRKEEQDFQKQYGN